MGASFIQLPADSTGKKLRTYDKGAPGHDQYVVPTSDRSTTGIYVVHTGAHVVGASADSATAGRWWLLNPVGSSVIVALERVHFMSQMGSVLAAPTSPRITLERMTFTGTPSGASVTAAKRVTSDATPVGTLRTASTGITPSAGAAIISFLTSASATAVGYAAPGESFWLPDEENQILLAAGEGIICRQADAGTTADTRRYVTNICWSEFTMA